MPLVSVITPYAARKSNRASAFVHPAGSSGPRLEALRHYNWISRVTVNRDRLPFATYSTKERYRLHQINLAVSRFLYAAATGFLGQQLLFGPTQPLLLPLEGTWPSTLVD